MKLFYWVTLFFSIICSGQNYTTKWYGMDNGLPQNSIKDIIKDKYGFIWLSTEGGVLRWDGDNFTIYDHFKLKNVSFGDFYGSVHKDSITIYSNFYEEGLLINKRNPKVLSVKKVASPMFFVNKERYERFAKNSMTTRIFKYINHYFIQLNKGSYYFDNQSIKYVDKKNGKAIKIDIKFPHTRLKKVFVHREKVFIADDSAKKLLQLYHGQVSVVTAPSIYTDPDAKIYWQQSSDQVFIVKKGDIYLSHFDGRQFTTKFLLQDNDIVNDVSGAMFYDNESNKLYIGSAIKGLKILSLSNFYVSKKKIPYEDENYYSALPFGKHSIITQQGIEYFRDKTRRAFPAELTHEKRYLLYDDSGNLIYRDENTLQKRLKKFQFARYDSIFFKQKKVEGIYKSGGLYMSAVSDYSKLWNLYIYKNDQYKQIDKTFRFPRSINSVLRYSKDMLYVGCNSGIYIVSLSKNKIIKNIAKNLPVKEIIRTKDGNIWLTTYSRGIYFLDEEKVIKIPSDKNNYISTAHTLREDNHSNFWISTNNGLFKASKKAFLQIAKNKSGTVTYYHYTKADGFSNNEFNGSANPSSNVLPDGQFVFPSLDGFVFFKPEEVKTYFPKPGDVFVERAKIDNDSIHFKDNLHIKKGYKKADIFIDIPYYSNIENIYLQAKLDDTKDSEWINISDDRKFSIANVKPGKYTLNVRFLTGNDGKFAYKKIPVEIEAFFYQTTVFKVLWLFVFIVLILVIVQIRTDFLRFKNKDLERELSVKDKELKETKHRLKDESEYQKQLISAITHDITTPVKFISTLSKQLVKAEDAHIQKMCFDSIYKSSEELYKFTLGLKQYAELYKQENADDEEYMLFNIIESKKLLFEEIALQKNIHIFNLCDESIKIKINQNILSVIFHNIIDNAVKNTNVGKIVISAVLHASAVEVSIADTGIGMSKEKMKYYNYLFKNTEVKKVTFENYGLGLHMVNQLIRKTNSEIFFKNNEPKGTIAVITIKTGDDKENTDS